MQAGEVVFVDIDTVVIDALNREKEISDLGQRGQ